MNILKNCIAAGLLACVLIPGTVSAMGIEAAVGGWNQDPSGDLSYKQQTGLDNLSIGDNLRYGDETRIFGRVKIEMPLFFPNIYLMATPMSFDNTGSKIATFKFGNTSFDGAIPFTSRLQLDHYDVDLYYGIPGLKLVTAGILNVDVGLGARIFDFKAELTGSSSGQTVTETEKMTLATPTLYVGIQVKPVTWLALEGEARGIISRKTTIMISSAVER